MAAFAIATAGAVVPKTPIPVIEVDGRGFGHGVGMAQDGALAMGAAGATTQEILEQFYPGTTIAKSSGTVRVPVLTGNNVTLGFPEGGEIRGAGSMPVKVPAGGAALVTRDGDTIRVSVAKSTSPSASTTTSTATTTTTSTTAPPVTLFPNQSRTQATALTTTTTTAPRTTTTTAPPTPAFTGSAIAVPNGDGRVAVTPRDRRYRGTIDIAAVAGGLRFVNQVNVETYLRGMGEVRNPSWPVAALRAQAIAARTYALRAMAAAAEICETQRCQVYIGSDAEYAAMDKAVAATSGQVLTYGKALVSAVYSANGGCFSANREEGFGLSNSSYPYLRAAPYLCDDPAPWTTTIALRDVASRLRYRGTLTSVEVTQRGPSGRAIVVHLTGSDGDKTVGGLAFGRALGLRSTMFNARITTAIKVPALTGGSTLQAPPEDAAAIAETTNAPVDEPTEQVHEVASGLNVPKPDATHPSRGATGAAALLLLVSLALLVRWRRQRQVAELLSAFEN